MLQVQPAAFFFHEFTTYYPVHLIKIGYVRAPSYPKQLFKV